MPSAALRLSLQELRDRVVQGVEGSPDLLRRIDAVLASWSGVLNKDIKARYQVNHDTLWRTKRQLVDGGVEAFLNAQKRGLRA